MERDDNLTDAETAAPVHGGYKIPALRALSEITTSLSTDSDVEDLLERFLSTMVKLAGAIGGAVRVTTPDGVHLRLIGAIGLPQEVIAREQFVPLECGIRAENFTPSGIANFCPASATTNAPVPCPSATRNRSSLWK